MLVVANPAAGGGRAARAAARLVAELSALGVPFRRVDTRARGHARELAAAAEPECPVIAVGGDGTVHEVVAGLSARDGCLGPLAILPCGTGDDFARSLGLSAEPARLARVLASSPPPRPVDVGLATVTDDAGTHVTRFANAAGLGFDAAVAAEACRPHRLRGKLHYIASTLAVLRRMPRLDAAVTLVRADGTLERLAPRALAFVAPMNGRYFGGGLRLVPGGRVDDGCLDVIQVAAVSPLGLAALLAKLVVGRHLGDPRVRSDAVTRVEVALDAPAACAFDGEPWPRPVRRATYALAPERLLLLGAPPGA